MMDVQVDTTQLSRRIEQYAQRLGKSLREMTIDAGARTGLRLIQFTQPYGSGARALATGRAAVERDIRKVAAGVERGMIQRALELGGGRVVNVTIATRDKRIVRLDWPQVSVSGAGLAVAHRARRNHRGRVSGRGSGSRAGDDQWNEPRRLVVAHEARAEYIRQVQRRVGLAKAGWAAALVDLTGTTRGIARWISALIGQARGRAVVQSPSELFTSVTLWNDVPHAGHRHVLHPRSQVRAVIAAHRQLARDYQRAIARERL